MAADDLVARARELGAPMLAPEAGIARRSVLLLKLADRVEELEGERDQLRAACDGWIRRGNETVESLDLVKRDRDRIRSRVEELEGLLLECEWSVLEPRRCPRCEQTRAIGHAPGCRLARALAPAAAGGEGT